MHQPLHQHQAVDVATAQEGRAEGGGGGLSLQAAAGDVASELARNPNPKYAASELHAFASNVRASLDSLSGRSQHHHTHTPTR
jgi:hypothetical protein